MTPTRGKSGMLPGHVSTSYPPPPSPPRVGENNIPPLPPPLPVVCRREGKGHYLLLSVLSTHGHTHSLHSHTFSQVNYTVYCVL